MAASRNKALPLYISLLRESKKFVHYSFREYTLRRVKESFRENAKETNTDKIAKLIQYAEENLGIIKRQVVINQLYEGKKLIIEKPTNASV